MNQETKPALKNQQTGKKLWAINIKSNRSGGEEMHESPRQSVQDIAGVKQQLMQDHLL